MWHKSVSREIKLKPSHVNQRSHSKSNHVSLFSLAFCFHHSFSSLLLSAPNSDVYSQLNGSRSDKLSKTRKAQPNACSDSKVATAPIQKCKKEKERNGCRFCSAQQRHKGQIPSIAEAFKASCIVEMDGHPYCQCCDVPLKHWYIIVVYSHFFLRHTGGTEQAFALELRHPQSQHFHRRGSCHPSRFVSMLKHTMSTSECSELWIHWIDQRPSICVGISHKVQQKWSVAGCSGTHTEYWIVIQPD